VLLVIATEYSRLARAYVLARDLQYIPPQATIIAAIGHPRDLWSAIDEQFGRAIRDTSRDGYLASTFRTTATNCKDKGFPINNVDDLEKYGLDIDRGMLFCVLASEGATDEKEERIAVIHIVDREKFLQFIGQTQLLQSVLGTGNRNVGRHECEHSNSTRVHVTSLADGTAFTEPTTGTLILGNSCFAVLRSLSDTAGNLRYQRTLDSLYEAALTDLRQPLESGPAVFLFWRPGTNDRSIPFLANASIAVKVRKRELTITGQVAVTDNQVRIIDDLLKAPPTEVPWSRYLPSQIPGLIVGRDWQFSEYSRLFGTFDPSEEYKAYGDFLATIQAASGVRQLVFSALDYRSAILSGALGLWGDPGQLASIVQTARSTLREQRDEFIIEAATTQFRKLNSIPAETAISIEQLRNSQLLTKENPDLFERYSQDRSVDSGKFLSAEDFKNESYEKLYRGWRILFIAPPFTTNDLTYGFSGEVVAKTIQNKTTTGEVESTILRSNRFRLAGVLIDDTLWVSTEETSLEKIIDAYIDHGREEDEFARTPLARYVQKKPKVQIILNIPVMISQGLLNPDKQASDFTRRILMDFQEHDVAVINFSVERETQKAILSARLPMATNR
jgi:hypothetical protein